MLATTFESPAQDWKVEIPTEYRAFQDEFIFSKLDLRSMYNLIHIQKGDEWNTTFITPADHYEYLVMPYCLSNSPSIFQGFMNEVLRDYLHRFMIVYIDDILIYLQNKVDHRLHALQVVQWLREKWKFHQPSIQFLGYIINASGVKMDQGKGKSSNRLATSILC